MKRLDKKVIMGTTAGIATLVLNACGAYGPAPTAPTTEVSAPEAVIEESSSEESSDPETPDEKADDTDTNEEHRGKDDLDLVPTVYGPPPAGK